MRIDKTLAIVEVFSADGVRAYLWHRKIEKSKNRKIEKSKNRKIEKSKNRKIEKSKNFIA
jgi:hypothetical protein